MYLGREQGWVYTVEGRVWRPSPALFPVCTTLGSRSGLAVTALSDLASQKHLRSQEVGQ